MLHTKSQGHRPSGSGEEDFLRFFTIYGRGGHLGHVTKTIWTNFCSPILRSLHMKYEFNWPSSFRGEDVWKCWRTTDGRTTDAGVTGILLAHQWAFGSGELKISIKLLCLYFGAAFAAPNKGTVILYWFRSLSTVLCPTENRRIQGLSRHLSDFQGLFKTVL